MVRERFEEHVPVHVREPARLAHERVAVEQHEGGLGEALDERLEEARPREREEQVRVAEPRVDLDGQRIAGRLVRLEPGE
jgi:hypothetical protein